LRSPDSPGTGRQPLTELRQALSTAGPQESSAAIVQFLNSRSDAPTGKGFKPGAKGALEEAPTLRVFLLDYLAGIDPAAAAAYARTMLASKDSPDEWAIALRTVALFETGADGRAFVEGKTREMLQFEPWQQNPSVGFLEAFDAAVYLGGTNLVPTLAELVRSHNNPAVAHAAFLSLDRLVIKDPASLLTTLAAEPALMQGREQTRANYFARADVRDAQQRQVLEGYLLDSRIGVQELEQFAGLYPNANYMVSHNLLTPVPTPDNGSLLARDAESLRAVQQWLTDPSFTKLRPQLEKMKGRLEEFARQAQR
jgi:hypothetical protein